MSKFSIDFKKLENQILKKAYRLSEVEDKLEKVAFDIVRFKDGDQGANLWQVQNTDDGDYIVALYEDEQTKIASKNLNGNMVNNWEVIASNNSQTVDVFYKGDHLIKIKASKIGIPSSEISLVEKYLPKKLSENKKLVSSLLKEMPETTKKEVLSKYPELV